jgi:predicted acetyltransferase
VQLLCPYSTKLWVITVTQFKYSTLSTPEEAQRFGVILDQCFNSPPNSGIYFNRVGLENFRTLRQTGQIVGGLALLHMGQWFGGQCVPMTGIAAVGIAPEYRGAGAALSLMQQMLQELSANEVPLSALYPATQRLYRKVGYEQAGTLCGWEMPTESIQKQERSPVQAMPLSHETLQPLYQQQAKLTNGNLDRNAALWQQVLQPAEKETLYGYLLGPTDRPEGYLIYSQQRINGKTILQVKDWVVLSPAAVQGFWAFVADHRSMLKQVRWRGSAIDPLTLGLAEQTATLTFTERWMLRIVNVVKALEKRGYPAGVEAELHLEIHDDLLPENNGKFILSVSQGRGEVTPGGKGELQLDIRGLAPLYTGLFTPAQLQLTGHLATAALSTATLLFAGTSPWMPDSF